MNAALAKIAQKLATTFLTSSKEQKSKILKFILFLVLFITLSVPIMFSLPGILLKGIDLKNNDTGNFSFNSEELSKNKNYIKIRDTYLKYLEDIDLDIDKKVEQIKKDYTYERTYYVDVLDEKGKKIGEEKKTETVVPEVIKDVRIERPELRYVLAYLGTKYMEEQNASFDGVNFQYNEKEIKKFMKSIMVYSESISGQDPITYKVRYEVLDLEKIAEASFTFSEYQDGYKDKREIFKLSYESMEDYTDTLANSVCQNIDISTLNISEKGMEIPLMLQYDAAWGKASYGATTIKSGGCAILCMAMVQAYLIGEVPNPINIATWSSQNNFYYRGIGTSWSFFKAYSNTVGITSSDLSKNTIEVIKALEDGKPVIASMKSGTFTSDGHFIVLRGITKNGKILVNDPNDNFYSKNFFEKEFDYSLIYSEAKNFWSFEID